MITAEERKEIVKKFYELGEEAKQLKGLIGPIAYNEARQIAQESGEGIRELIVVLRHLMFFYDFIEHLPPKTKAQALLDALERVAY